MPVLYHLFFFAGGGGGGALSFLSACTFLAPFLYFLYVSFFFLSLSLSLFSFLLQVVRSASASETKLIGFNRVFYYKGEGGGYVQ